MKLWRTYLELVAWSNRLHGRGWRWSIMLAGTLVMGIVLMVPAMLLVVHGAPWQITFVPPLAGWATIWGWYWGNAWYFLRDREATGYE